MATPVGREVPPVERTLFEEPFRFDFFQAVRLLERLAPGLRAVGREGPARREVARFGAARGLAFPASAIQALDGSGEGPAAMTVGFMGLTGPMGVLPHSYTEMVVERQRAGDRTLAAFLDLFNHRLISLFYRAWEKYRPGLAYERGADDPFAGAIDSLIGLGMEPLRGRHAFPDAAPRFYAGLFAQRHRSAVMLERLLREYFGLPVEVLQFQGRWLRLDPADRSRLGASNRNNQMGVSLVVGERVRDEQGRFRLRLGPLTIRQFRALSPEGPAFRALVEMTRLYVDAELDFDVQLVLLASDVPDCRLGAGDGPGARLGRDAWLKVGPLSADADEAVHASGV